MRIERAATDAVEIPPRSRETSHETVERLAASMKEHGLLHPITLYEYEEGQCRLVAGLHRLLAARSLGWEFIDAIFLDGSDDAGREMVEIAENLHRAELTALERDQQVARYADLVAQKVAQSAPLKPGHGRGTKGGDREAARQLGIERTDIQRAGKVAGLSPEAKAAAVETGLDDNRSALLEAAKEAEPAAQAEKLRDIKRRKDSRKQSKADDDRDLKEQAVEKVACLLAEHVPGEHWDALKASLFTICPPLAKEFQRLIGISVFDNTRSGRAA